MSRSAVIFDLDGTLLDTLDDLANAVNHFLRTHGYPERTKNEVRNYLGNGARDLIRRSLPEKVDDGTFAEYVKEYMEYYNAHSQIETKPYDGVLRLLDELKGNGILTAVVSNKPDVAVKDLCRKYFGDLVDFALGDRDDIARKPSAEPVLYAMDAIGCQRAVYVGDSEVDILTARNANLPCVSLAWGFRDREFLEERGAAHLADNAEELKRLIFELLTESENFDASR